MGEKLDSIIRKLKYVCALLISLVPFSLSKVLLYRILFGYRISLRAKIGFGTIISVSKAQIGKVRIERFNVFTGPFELCLADGASIGPRNKFNCGSWVVQGRFREYGYLKYFRMGAGAMITGDHYFDVVGGIELGNGSWIAGRSSQFWTHGTKIEDRSISIGSGCYIGSAVRFAPGTKVGNNCLVGLGSVVTKKFEGDNLMIAGMPAKVIKEDYKISGASSGPA